MELIPLIDSPRQTMTVTLDGQTLSLELVWLPLPAHWYLSLTELEGDAIASGRQVAPLVRLVRSDAFAGDIVAIARRDGDLNPVGRDSWGVTHDLLFLTADEVETVDWP